MALLWGKGRPQGIQLPIIIATLLCKSMPCLSGTRELMAAHLQR